MPMQRERLSLAWRIVLASKADGVAHPFDFFSEGWGEPAVNRRHFFSSAGQFVRTIAFERGVAVLISL